MHRIKMSYTCLAANTAGYANDVTASSGTAFTLSTDEPGDGLAHKIIITPSGSVTGSYGISGKDANGAAISETLATNTINAVTSANHYASDIAVTAPSGLGAETVDIGWTVDAVSPWKATAPQGEYRHGFNMGISCAVAGTPTYTVQYTIDGATAFNHATIAAKSANFADQQAFPVGAIRLLFAAAGTVTLVALQY